MALVVFRSKAAAEIFMFAETAQRMLQIIGKDDAERGVIRGADLAIALQRLQDAVEAEKSALRDARARQLDDERRGEPGGEALPPITLGQPQGRRRHMGRLSPQATRPRRLPPATSHG
jgi:hypothetical protein